MFSGLLTTFSRKNSTFGDFKSDQDPDWVPYWYGSLDPDPHWFQ
jgi:hypothetical protein